MSDSQTNWVAVPPFEERWPSRGRFSPEQKAFYLFLRGSLRKARFPNVDGNISYLFLYAYETLGDRVRLGFEYLYQHLLDLSEAYQHERMFPKHCRWWAFDCVLGSKKYEEYLALTEPLEIFKSENNQSNRRLNVQFMLGLPANGVDLYRMGQGSITRLTRKYPGEFRRLISRAFAEDAEENGPWFKRLIEAGDLESQYADYLFSGSACEHPKWKEDIYCFYALRNPRYDQFIRAPIKKAENRLRDLLGVPRIGEGWIRETELFKTLESAFPQTMVLHHGQPPWLGMQHFDVWIPRWKIAVEHQGIQHFTPVDFFGGEKGLSEVRVRDERKRRLCKENGIHLLEVTEETPFQHVVEEIELIREGIVSVVAPSDS